MRRKEVSETDLNFVMMLVRDFRRCCLENKIDPWAVRQGLIIALVMDTKAAMERGVKERDLWDFDLLVKTDIELWLKREGKG